MKDATQTESEDENNKNLPTMTNDEGNLPMQRRMAFRSEYPSQTTEKSRENKCKKRTT